MLSECPMCCGTGYQDQSTRCFRCNGKGFHLVTSDYTVTNITEEPLDNSNSTSPQEGLS